MLAIRREDGSLAGATGWCDAPAVPRSVCESCDVRPRAICGALGIDEIHRLEAIAIRRQLGPGQVLFHEGDPASGVFNVTHGMIKLYKLLSDGRRQITGFLLPGDFLGLACASRYGYTAEAVVPTSVCRIARSRFLQLLEEFPALEKALLDRASDELAAAQEQMLVLGRKSARERVASFLALMCRRQGLQRDDPQLPLPMSRGDIADYLGLTLETVSRMLSGLRADRILAPSDANEAMIADRRRLEQAAGV